MKRAITSRLAALIQAAGRRFGYELVAQRSVTTFLHDRGIDLVVDVGANRGQFALNLRHRGYTGAILSFEPAAQPFAALVAAAARDPLWTAQQLALGDQDGTLQLNIAHRQLFNSAKPLTPLAANYPGARVVGSEEVPVRRLDGLASIEAARRMFLKIDTQGFEAEVIAGATGVLDRVHGVQLELPVEHLYAGVWSLSEGIEAMADHGFALAQVRPVTKMHDDPVAALEFDCLFRRRR